MKIPLHLDPNDTTRAAAIQRLELWEKMMAANPKGFRQPTNRRKNSGITMKLNTLIVNAWYAPLEGTS